MEEDGGDGVEENLERLVKRERLSNSINRVGMTPFFF